MKAILMKPVEGVCIHITEIETDMTLDQIHTHLDCRTFACVYLNDNHVMYVDEEGMFTKSSGIDFNEDLLESPYQTQFFGNMLIVSDDGEGGSTDCRLNVNDLIGKARPFIVIR